MNIVLLGLSHKTAPVEVRERLAFNESRLPGALANLVDQVCVDEGVIVSTCNRVELIASAPAGIEKGIDRLQNFLCDFHELPLHSIHSHLYLHADSEAIKHLFRVASALDSMVVGESQILGQVKEAYRTAIEAGTVGRVLSQLMHRALSVAKRVRTETGVALHPVSISSVAVELANKIFGDLTEKTVMLVGAGDMAELAAQSLMQAGAHKLLIANRTAEKAANLAQQYNGGAISFAAFYETLPAVDIVICSTGAADYVIRPEETRRALKSRRKGPLLFIDISVPRNIDPGIANLDSTFLFDIDDLQGAVQSNLKEREREAQSAEVIIESETQSFMKHLRSLDIGPQVVEVKAILAQLALNELKRHRKRLGALNAEQESAITEILIPALVNKLSHPLIAHMRATARHEEPTDTLEELRKLIRID
ncbi:MAG: glutamyl-tRNA reductase [Acidobacteria bacterium]|nr:glutamyl-tRNA reductase [Acidobacteriota bacterium]